MTKARRRTAVALLCLLAFADLFTVGKRYLNDGDFITEKYFGDYFAERPVDKTIHADSTLSYRVLDLTVDPFSDMRTPYLHKSLGGYSAAKIGRYDDLITTHLNPEIDSIYHSAIDAVELEQIQANLPSLPVLSALNTKYIIVGDDIDPVVNGDAMGNAWFVDCVSTVSTADEALKLMGEVDLHQTALLEPAEALKFNEACTASGQPSPTGDEDSIVLTSYAPNELRYHYSLKEPALTLFSEIHYPNGWRAWIDGDKGSELSLFRADWVLRAAVLPAGEHDIVMRFVFPALQKGVSVSRASSILLFLLLILSSAFVVMKKEEGDN